MKRWLIVDEDYLLSIRITEALEKILFHFIK